METKKCCTCGEVKGVTEFHKNRSTRDGLQSACKPCMRAAVRRSWRGHPETQKAYRKSHPELYREMRYLHSVKCRAKALDVPFALTMADLPSMPETCPVLGIQLHRGDDTPRACSPNLYRLIPARGYVPGNVIWLSNEARRNLARQSPQSGG